LTEHHDTPEQDLPVMDWGRYLRSFDHYFWKTLSYLFYLAIIIFVLRVLYALIVTW
jgi:hypothetical protein